MLTYLTTEKLMTLQRLNFQSSMEILTKIMMVLETHGGLKMMTFLE